MREGRVIYASPRVNIGLELLKLKISHALLTHRGSSKIGPLWTSGGN